MPRNSEQKIKLLILYDILRKNTDENHPMTTKEIVAALQEYGIGVSRKTLYEDIDLLVRYGYDIICIKGRNNQYFVGGHDFERPEIEVLLNAVSASKLLTQAKSSALSEKLAELLGKPQGNELKNTVTVTSNKSDNERIYYTIDAITTGKNTQVIKEYIKNQLKKDKENMQLSIDYPEDPFTGSKE